jgi:hypothetical protein
MQEQEQEQKKKNVCAGAGAVAVGVGEIFIIHVLFRQIMTNDERTRHRPQAGGRGVAGRLAVAA